MILKSINYWSFPGGLEGKLDPIEAIELAAKCGFEALEFGIFGSGPLGLDQPPSKWAEIRTKAEKSKIQLASTASGLYWSRSLADQNEANRAKAADDIRKMLQISAWLGAKTLLVIPGAVDVFFMEDRQVQSYDEVLSHSVAGLKSLAPEAERLGVRMGIENVWNRFLLSPTEMVDFLSKIGSPFVGAYLDVANVLPFGYPEQWIRILKHRLVGVHFKDFRRKVGTAEGFVDLLEGDVNWPEVMKALTEVSYSGPVACEMIPAYKHHPMVRVLNASAAMDAILGRPVS